MDAWLRLILAILATWRLAHLLAREDGPGAVLARLRARLGAGGAGAELFGCVYCLSLVVAAPLAAFVTRDPLQWLVSWLAVSGAASLFERYAPEPVVIQQLAGTEGGESDDALLWPGATRPDAGGDTGVPSDTPAERRRRAGGA